MGPLPLIGLLTAGALVGDMTLKRLFEAYGDTEEKALRRKGLKEEYAKRRAYGVLAEQEGLRGHIQAGARSGMPQDLDLIEMLSGTGSPSAGLGQRADLQEIMGLGQRVAQGSRLPVDPVLRALGITSEMI